MSTLVVQKRPPAKSCSGARYRQVCLLDALISQGGLFGDWAQQFSAVQKQAEAIAPLCFKSTHGLPLSLLVAKGLVIPLKKRRGRQCAPLRNLATLIPFCNHQRTAACRECSQAFPRILCPPVEPGEGCTVHPDPTPSRLSSSQVGSLSSTSLDDSLHFRERGDSIHRLSS
ncbi:hypothetical protein PO909_008584 [Leuciscus waleckii]